MRDRFLCLSGAHLSSRTANLNKPEGKNGESKSLGTHMGAARRTVGAGASWLLGPWQAEELSICREILRVSGDLLLPCECSDLLLSELIDTKRFSG